MAALFLVAALANGATARAFVVEPSTLVSLGFEWRIDGDDNRNATVAVSYRKRGETAWKQGPPLLRIGHERINENALQYVVPNGFAGSIFDLEPATEYECRFVLSDPDGASGRREQVVTVRTRAEPTPFAGGRTYHVYPPGFSGARQEPAFTGLLAAYYTGSSSSTTSTPTRRACSRATSSSFTPVYIRMTGTATAPASARSRAAPTSSRRAARPTSRS